MIIKMKIDWNWSTEIVNPALLFFGHFWTLAAHVTIHLHFREKCNVKSFFFCILQRHISLEPQEGEEMMTGFQVN